MLATRHLLLAALLLAACKPPTPAPRSPTQSQSAPRPSPRASEAQHVSADEAPAEDDAPPADTSATLRATPETDLRVGERVEVCWEALGAQRCTLSILHASGEGDFGDVAASGCRPVIMERTTLIELFCANNTHALLQLDAAE